MLPLPTFGPFLGGGLGSFLTNPMFMGGALGALGSMFNRSQFKNPADAGMPYLNQIPGEMNQYLGPYASMGQNIFPKLQNEFGNLMGGRGALQGQYNSLMGNLPQLQGQYNSLLGGLPGLQSQYNQMSQNPGDFINNIGKGFQQSPGYQFQVDQATNAANRAGAAGGMLGSPMEQHELANSVSGLANQDYYNWLNQALSQHSQGLSGQQDLYGMGLNGINNLYGMGLQGNQNLYGMGLTGMNNLGQMGFNASNSMAENLAQALMSQANMQAMGANAQNQSNSQNTGGMLGGLASALSAMFGGGR